MALRYQFYGQEIKIAIKVEVYTVATKASILDLPFYDQG